MPRRGALLRLAALRLLQARHLPAGARALLPDGAEKKRSLVVFFRNMLFDYGIFSSKEYSVPIISVGNLCAGGSGKSPLAEYILRLIDNRDKVAVLSRGYGRDSTGFQWVTNKSFVKDVGDEPLQIARKFPEINVAVSESRNKGIQEIIHKECDLILLDDAYQHRWVKPGLNILLTTYDNLFIKDNLLPYGRLRESKKNFWRADIIVVTKTPYPLLPLDEFRLKEQISPFFNQKLCYSYLEYQKPVSLYTKKSVSIEGKNVIFVPFFLVFPTFFKGFIELPSLNLISYSLPSLNIFNSRVSERAFTTDTPTPCKPPETL